MGTSTLTTYESMYRLDNLATIKSNSPLTSTRKVRTTVPIVNPGIPFLPK
jgi:hypothetical protein